MQQIQFTSSLNQSVTINYEEDYLLQDLRISSIDAENLNEASFNQDGSTYLDSLFQERNISFRVIIFGNTPQERYQKRRNLFQIFNPKLGEGTLVYTNDNDSKSLTCVSDRLPVTSVVQQDVTANTLAVVVSLTANDPYFFDNNVTTRQLQDFLNRFRFPFHFPVVFSLRGDNVIVNNNGDVETPVKVTFFGPARNPQITNVTKDVFIKLNRNLLLGERLVVNTAPNNITIEFIAPNGQTFNSYSSLDPTSSLSAFSLLIGDNTLTFEAEEGSPLVEIEYRQRWVGI